jgi:hypothetical protein
MRVIIYFHTGPLSMHPFASVEIYSKQSCCLMEVSIPNPNEKLDLLMNLTGGLLPWGLRCTNVTR